MSAKAKEAANRRWHNDIPVPAGMGMMLDGLVASDGSLVKHTQAHFCLVSKYAEFVNHIQRIFKYYGIWSVTTGTKSGNFTVRTSAYHSIASFWDRWYSSGKKTIPEDFVVSPTSMRYWYAGDGSLKRQKKTNSFTAELATYAFRPSSVVRIADQLGDALGSRRLTRVYMLKAGPILSVSTAGVERFLRYVSPCPTRCFAYKWDISAMNPRVIKGDLCVKSVYEIEELDQKWANAHLWHKEWL